ncbi:CPBP family intramembrane metalloprotease [Brevibacterium aurantiacum]|uniref:CPBP family intramembrane metalloprotease n=2 Tax=Brevibacterium aurantiacum TaxID=273384 RepID=A0A556C5M8_BREAU|nr:CPBP family intramembrane metalloprotease [Brevibacterium aurantiacum]
MHFPRLETTLREYPLISFFVLANLLSWLAWAPYILSHDGLGILDFRVPAILGSGQLLGVLPGAYLGPITSAFLLTALIDGRAGLKSWLGRLWRWKTPLRWYVISVLAVPAGMVLTGLVFSQGHIAAPSVTALLAFVPMFLFQMVTTGLAEEPGWRDFALPRLQCRFSPLNAACILGPLWGIWHLPLFLTEWGGYPDATWVRPAAFLIFCFAFNIVMSWVFNRTGQSLPLSMMMHVSANTFASLMWSELFPLLDADGELIWIAMALGSSIAAVIIVATTRGRLGHPNQDPAISPSS